uniref:Pyrin domain-containing protein n=1 Tax=Electrophorus electricus TaxID=8005 RepID=A0A4W4EP99_ELEEL
MANIAEELLATLKELLSHDMKSFKWHLTSGVEGFERIPKAELENADRHDIVDKMLQNYGPDGAVEITVAMLKKINQNQLAEELQSKHCENHTHYTLFDHRENVIILMRMIQLKSYSLFKCRESNVAEITFTT